MDVLLRTSENKLEKKAVESNVENFKENVNTLTKIRHKNDVCRMQLDQRWDGSSQSLWRGTLRSGDWGQHGCEQP